MDSRNDHIFKATMLAVEEAKRKEVYSIDKVLIWAAQYGKRNKVTKDEARKALYSNLHEYLISDISANN